MKIQTQLSPKAYQSSTGFIGNYQKLIKETVIPYQYKVLCDQAEGAEKSHVLTNFKNAGKVLRGEDPGDGFYGMVFQDSDAAKWLEAVAYSLSIFPDPELEQQADEVIDLIANAQDQDGYLNTYFTIKDQDKRWKNLMEGHELYCSGHMIEAACAYYEVTGKDKFLNVMKRNADHIYNRFITQQCEGFPGHPEVELALMKLYRSTGEERYLQLAKHFVDVRGVDPHFYEKEAAKRDWTVWGNDPTDHKYEQYHTPVRQQTDATGHAVRAVYLYTAMADLAAETKDESLLQACDRLWKSITNRQMYITGGIGSTVIGEAFSVDYDLPSDTAYAETCASIGLMFFASKMLENKVDRIYSDVMERAFYNTVLAGMQLDGKKFFYVNPLEVVPGISGISQTHRHDLPERPKWYTCACCPPNVARLISSFGQYAYGENETTAFCHLYAEGEISFHNGLKLECQTQYPYEFTISYRVLSGENEIAIRIPAWSQDYKVEKNGDTLDTQLVNGYVYLSVTEGDTITLTLDSKPYFVYPSSKIPSLSGKVSICRGPLVYCLEGVDNEGDVLSISIDTTEQPKVEPYKKDLLNGTTRIKLKGSKVSAMDSLYSLKKPDRTQVEVIAVPYYTWGNRGINQMRVWISEE